MDVGYGKGRVDLLAEDDRAAHRHVVVVRHLVHFGFRGLRFGGFGLGVLGCGAVRGLVLG